MSIQDLAKASTTSVFTEDDRIMHTQKMVERTFGMPASDLGQIILLNSHAILSFEYNGQVHTLRWQRTERGAIVWYLDESERSIVLGEQARALARLFAVLG